MCLYLPKAKITDKFQLKQKDSKEQFFFLFQKSFVFVQKKKQNKIKKAHAHIYSKQKPLENLNKIKQFFFFFRSFYIYSEKT